MKELGWRIGDVLHTRIENVKRTTVDCGTCPVSLQCVAADQGNGWKFDCCGAAAVEIRTDDGYVLLIMDCADNRFRPREIAAEFSTCPLCSGDVVKSDLFELGEHHRYLPTVHAKVPLATRLEVWRVAMPEALDLKKRIDERNKKK